MQTECVYRVCAHMYYVYTHFALWAYAYRDSIVPVSAWTSNQLTGRLLCCSVQYWLCSQSHPTTTPQIIRLRSASVTLRDGHVTELFTWCMTSAIASHSRLAVHTLGPWVHSPYLWTVLWWCNLSWVYEHLYFTKHGSIIYMKKKKTTKLT